MSNVSCPRCGDSFRLPESDLPAGASARCPWCGEILPVAQLLSNLPPVAEVFVGSGEPWSTPAAAPQPSFAEVPAADDNEPLDDVVLVDDADWHEHDLESVPERRDVGAYYAEEHHQPYDPPAYESSRLEYSQPAEPRPLSEVADVSFDPDHQRLNTRARTKKKSTSVRSMVGIAIGGLMAFPLAAVILALLGKPLDLGFWPFDGKTITTGSSAKMAAPPALTDGSQASHRPPATAPTGRSLLHDLPRESSSSVVQADHNSPYLPTPDADSLADHATPADGGDAAESVSRGDSAPIWSRRPRPLAGAHAAGPELVEPLAVESEAFPLPSLDDPTSSVPRVVQSDSEPLDSENPAAQTDEATVPERGLAEPEPLVIEDAPVLQFPGLELPSIDSPLTVPQPADPPSIEAIAEVDGEDRTADSDELSPEPATPLAATDTTLTRPDNTLSLADAALTPPGAEDVADAAVPTAIDETPLSEDQGPTTAFAEAPMAGDGMTEDSAVEQPAAGDAASVRVGDTEPAAPPLAQPQPSSPQLQAALESAEEARKAVEDFVPVEGTTGLKRRLANLYASVAAVGEVAEQQDETFVAAMIEELKAGDLIKDLAPAAPNWLKYAQRPNNGMLAVGTLRQESSRWFVDWSGAAPLEIRTRGGNLPAAGTQVLVIGRLVSAELTAPVVETVHLAPLN